MTKEKPTNIEIELEALKTIRAGYEAENDCRARRGESLAYGADNFIELADRMRNLQVDQLSTPKVVTQDNIRQAIVKHTSILDGRQRFHDTIEQILADLGFVIEKDKR